MSEAIPFASARKRNVEPTPAWGRDKGGIWIRCTCGIPVTLDVPRTHTVADDGTVSPSVWHVDCPTGWHTFVKLDGWRETANV